MKKLTTRWLAWCLAIALIVTPLFGWLQQVSYADGTVLFPEKQKYAITFDMKDPNAGDVKIKFHLEGQAEDQYLPYKGGLLQLEEGDDVTFTAPEGYHFKDDQQKDVKTLHFIVKADKTIVIEKDAPQMVMLKIQAPEADATKAVAVKHSGDKSESLPLTAKSITLQVEKGKAVELTAPDGYVWKENGDKKMVVNKVDGDISATLIKESDLTAVVEIQVAAKDPSSVVKIVQKASDGTTKNVEVKLEATSNKVTLDKRMSATFKAPDGYHWDGMVIGKDVVMEKAKVATLTLVKNVSASDYRLVQKNLYAGEFDASAYVEMKKDGKWVPFDSKNFKEGVAVLNGKTTYKVDRLWTDGSKVWMHFTTKELKLGDVITMYFTDKTGVRSEVARFTVTKKAIPLKVDPIYAGDKKITGTTEPYAWVETDMATRLVFAKKVKADKDGKFVIKYNYEFRKDDVLNVKSWIGDKDSTFEKAEKANEKNIKVLDRKVEGNRLAGHGRVDTAVEISKQAFPGGAKNVILAYGYVEADALAVGPLAKALDAPILLVGKTMDRVVQQELERLNPERIYLAGGTNSVSPMVEKAAKAVAPVKRLAGEDRYLTSVVVAKELASKVNVTSVILANGVTYADALSASALAGKYNAPILLVNHHSMYTSVMNFAKEYGKTVYVAGGSNSVSYALQNKFTNTKRLSGSDRAQTALAIAREVAPTGDQVVFANGYKYADALAAAPLLFKGNTVLMLTEADGSLSYGVKQYVKANNMSKGIFVGGVDSLPTWVLVEYQNLFQ